jgi:hypothetical protein
MDLLDDPYGGQNKIQLMHLLIEQQKSYLLMPSEYVSPEIRRRRRRRRR